MLGLIVAVKRIYDKYAEDEMTVYAAQVSFFIILSVVPFIMLLLTAVQMIPSVSNAQFMELIVGLVPVDYKSLAFRVVNDLSLKSPATMISVTAITALWSAGRGMFSVARGLNRVHGHGEKRWSDLFRLYHCVYTGMYSFPWPSGVRQYDPGLSGKPLSYCCGCGHTHYQFQGAVGPDDPGGLFPGNLHLCAG